MSDTPQRPLATYSQAALAAYLRGLGFESFVMPDGFPDAATQPRTSRGPASKSAGSPSGTQQSSPGPSEPQAAVTGALNGAAVQEAANFVIDASLTPEVRLTKLAEVREHASSCVACVLSRKRTSVVFGSGNEDADLMLIGEGPGAQEDRQGEPFVGPAGELLTKMLAAIGFDRDEVYIANVVKCRPPGNRDPKPEEVTACSGYLKAQIELVRPRVILALGRVAAQTLLTSAQSLGRMRGNWHEVHEVPVWVTYHPAALLRNASYKRPTWEDLQFVRDHLQGLPPVDGAS